MSREEKKKRIQEIATKLFVEKGFENTTIRDIARATGSNSAAIYYYFENKEGLLYQVLDETASTGLELIRQIDQSSQDLKEKLASVTDLYTKHYAVYKDNMKLFVHDQKSLTPEHKENLKKKQRDYVRVVVNLLENLKEQGEMRDFDTNVCGFAFFGMVHLLYRWYDPKGKIKPAQLSEIFHHIFTRGIFSEHS